jgi:small subunit ribosomal protein S7
MVKKYYKEKSLYFSDLKFGNYYIAKLINIVMKNGNKDTARNIVYEAIDIVQSQLQKDGNSKDVSAIIKEVIDLASPLVEVRKKRIGGQTYQIPVEVNSERQVSLALRWIAQIARKKSGKPMSQRLAKELIDILNNTGDVVGMKDNLYKTAAANKSYAHFAF